MSTCPDLESWCGFVDGSATAAESTQLDDHLQHCDRCFAVVTQLRLDLVDAAGRELSVSMGQRRPLAAAAYAAAAVLCLLWAGSLQWRHDTAAQPLATTAAESTTFGFAGAAAPVSAPLQESARVLILFAQFVGEAPIAVPAWAGSLASAAGAGCGPAGMLLSQATVVPRRLLSRWPVSAYAGSPLHNRRRFVEQIAMQLDEDVLRSHDGDEDGVVDFVIIVVGAAEAGGLPAGLQAGAGLEVDVDAGPMRISGSSRRSMLVLERAERTLDDICTHLHQAMSP